MERYKGIVGIFAVKATAYLKLKTKGKVRWKPFEVLFQVESLRQSKADYEKLYPDFTPEDADKINALFV